MAARAFSFTIPKPFASGTAGATADQVNMFNDLSTKYADADSGEQTADIIAYNFPTGNSVEIKFDRGFSRQVQQRVLRARFGEGYEQRVRDGINHKEESFGMSLANRRWEEIALISSFLDVVTPRSFPIVLERETIKVVCENYNVIMTQGDIQSIQTQLRRVYEA